MRPLSMRCRLLSGLASVLCLTIPAASPDVATTAICIVFAVWGLTEMYTGYSPTPHPKEKE